jgi:glyoxylase-like metal-dependent hydrolase (beta-lactamase superfamily II)
LLDRGNGLLFTGDTFYPGPIYLFAAGTDLEAYSTSIRRLAALAPQLKLVLGAHNVPVASPAALPRLVAAFEEVRGGKVAAVPDPPGHVLYKVDGFSFLMREPSAHER